MGLHPWHPDVLRMAPHQLHWAAIQASESRGNTPREDRETREIDQLDESALALIAWMDTHFTRRP